MDNIINDINAYKNEVCGCCGIFDYDEDACLDRGCLRDENMPACSMFIDEEDIFTN